MKRSSTAVWKGGGKSGSGDISSRSGALDHARYAWGSRFADERGTNPEELLAGAHASCFTMKLSFLLEDAGFTADTIQTTAEVSLENNAISRSHLIVRAKVPGISADIFQQCALEAKENCPVSKALNMEITMEAALSQSAHSESVLT